MGEPYQDFSAPWHGGGRIFTQAVDGPLVLSETITLSHWPVTLCWRTTPCSPQEKEGCQPASKALCSAKLRMMASYAVITISKIIKVMMDTPSDSKPFRTLEISKLPLPFGLETYTTRSDQMRTMVYNHANPRRVIADIMKTFMGGVPWLAARGRRLRVMLAYKMGCVCWQGGLVWA